MKRYILLIISAIFLLTASAQVNTLFAYPVAPESLPVGRPRANYIVEHFWDAMPWKKAHTMPRKMEQTVRDFADFLPLASADTVHRSLDKLIGGARKNADCFRELMRIAEATFHSDTALLFSDEVYLPFAKAASGFKKLPADRRAYYEAQARVIEASSEGSTLPTLMATSRDGSQFALNDTTSGAQSYVIIIETPGSESFERVRFSANYAVRQLADAGLLKPVLIYAGKAPDRWWDSVGNLPASWNVGEMPDAAESFDLRQTPAVYMFDPQMKVVVKWMPLGLLVSNCEQLIQNLSRRLE